MSYDNYRIVIDILKNIDGSERLAKDEIFRLSDIDRQAFDKYFDKLVDEGFIKYTVTPELKKEKVYKLSESGRYLLESLSEENETPFLEIAKDATKLKRTEFLFSLLRHDLMNKLGSIGFYQEFMWETNPPKEVEKPLEKMEDITQESIGLIEKINTFQEVGKEELREIRVDQVIDKVIDQTKTRATLEGMEIEKEDFEFTVVGGFLLEDLFSNLLENAVKHSGGDLIKVSATESEGIVTVTVEDNGEGIPEEEMDEVFKKGYKEERSSGSGLGLYLVKEIAESYRGSVEVKKSDLGGARFDLHLRKVDFGE